MAHHRSAKRIRQTAKRTAVNRARTAGSHIHQKVEQALASGDHEVPGALRVAEPVRRGVGETCSAERLRRISRLARSEHLASAGQAGWRTAAQLAVTLGAATARLVERQFL
jgi:ribosomal protein S20